jgi:hypothetical protein
VFRTLDLPLGSSYLGIGLREHQMAFGVWYCRLAFVDKPQGKTDTVKRRAFATPQQAVNVTQSKRCFQVEGAGPDPLDLMRSDS